MKLVSSMVRPARLDAVKDALSRLHASAVSVTETRDLGPQRHDTIVWRGRECHVGSSMKMELKVVVHDDDVDDVVKAIILAARTGAVGDGHVCVLPVEHRYNIHNGERDVS